MKRLFTLFLILFCTSLVQEVRAQILWEKTAQSASPQSSFTQLELRDSLIFLHMGGVTGFNNTSNHFACYSLSGRQKWLKPAQNGINRFTYNYTITPSNYLLHFYSADGYYPSFAEKIYTQKISTITGDTLPRKLINTTALVDFGMQAGILKDADGGYTISGESIVRQAAVGAAGKRKSSIIKLDSARNLVWQKHYGPGTFMDTHGLTRNSKGNYIMGGNIMHWLPSKGIWHPFVYEVKPNGDSLRRKTIFLKDPAFNETADINQNFINTPDGGYVFCGNIDSSSAVNDNLFYVAKVDSLFNLVWLHKQSGQFKDYRFSKIQLLPNSSFACLSNLRYTSNFFIFILDSNGQYVSHKPLQSNLCSQIYINDFRVLADSSAIVVGNGCGNNTAYVARYRNVLASTTITGLQKEPAFNLNYNVAAYPNPVGETVTFAYNLPVKTKNAELRISEIATGKLVKTVLLKVGEKREQVSVMQFKTGMYAYTLFADDLLVSTKKLVVVK